ncbi:uncharacterized protein SAPINGB_P004817 [Magnusiomyces paraingens]|uniref:Uncharacterized protein n=1 Tax=Magnusiomyces paraingens TaxID=2606893 RepID=A0A5E8C4N9_9ASCO|nr:uncharacterized protein SAPINGB_P004817 [Saprochaete ingens]VVT56106.1 unnamed protein product [Saprochaete ingens]
MPQGSLKKSTTKSPGRIKKQTSKTPKKAAPKTLAPKKRAAVKDAQIARKHTAALTGATEKILAAKIGHLELLKGTRKELEERERKKNDKKKKNTNNQGK